MNSSPGSSTTSSASPVDLLSTINDVTDVNYYDDEKFLNSTIDENFEKSSVQDVDKRRFTSNDVDVGAGYNLPIFRRCNYDGLKSNQVPFFVNRVLNCN